MHLDAVAGGAGGSWYLLMEGLGRRIGEIRPEIRIRVVEGGGVSNHARVGAGDVPMGILNPPMTAAAIAGRPPYEQAYPALRIGVTNLTTNYLHCFVERALPLDSVASWLERRQPVRMPVDRVGTVDRMVFQLALEHFGATEADVERWGGALVPARSYDEQLALYSAGTVNALWQFMGIPSPSGRRLAPAPAAGAFLEPDRRARASGLDPCDVANRRLRHGGPAGGDGRDGDVAGLPRRRPGRGRVQDRSRRLRGEGGRPPHPRGRSRIRSD